jgi:release factor glutamine methyltransferase
MEIYQPEKDSHLFTKFLKKYLTKHKVNSYLDMGTGSGVLSETASKFLDKKNILAADINPDAIALLKKKKFNSVKSNLFSKVKGKFDLITFNAPYLPLDKREPKDSQIATTGGKKGDEISVKFLKQAKKHLNKNGKIFLLISSLTPINKIKKFKHKIVARKKIFMEELLILEFTFS